MVSGVMVMHTLVVLAWLSEHTCCIDAVRTAQYAPAVSTGRQDTWRPVVLPGLYLAWRLLNGGMVEPNPNRLATLLGPAFLS